MRDVSPRSEERGFYWPVESLGLKKVSLRGTKVGVPAPD